MKPSGSTSPERQYSLNYQSINPENITTTNLNESALQSLESDESESETEDSPLAIFQDEIEAIKYCVVCANAYRPDAICRVPDYCRSCGWASTTGQALPHKIIPNAKCKVCSSKFATAWALECHQIRCRHLNEDACKHCGIPFRFKRGMKKHEYYCSRKKRSYTEASMEHADKVNAYGERPFGCDFCTRKYQTELDLKRHQELLKHYERPTFTCDKCHVVYYKDRRFKKHVCRKILTRQSRIKQENIEDHEINQRRHVAHYPKSYVGESIVKKVKHLQMKWRNLPNTSKFFDQLETAVRENDPMSRNQRVVKTEYENHDNTPMEKDPKDIKQENPEDLPSASNVINEGQSKIVSPVQTMQQSFRNALETVARENNQLWKVEIDNKENGENSVQETKQFVVKIEPDNPPSGPVEGKLRENFAGILEPVDVNAKPSKKRKRAKASNLCSWRCDECNKKFLVPKQLRQHQRQKHGPPMGPHECARCGELFRTKGLRKQHYKQRACSITTPATMWESVAAALTRVLMAGQPEAPVAPDDTKWVPIQNTGHLGNRFLPTQHP